MFNNKFFNNVKINNADLNIVSGSVSTGSLQATNSILSSLSTGNLYLSGDIYSSNGSVFVGGGGGGSGVTLGNFLTNQLYLGVSSMFSGSFTASNNTSVASNVTGFAFSNAGTRSFTAVVSVSVVRTGAANLYETYTLDGYQGDSGWYIGYRSWGDDTNVVFTITSSGQVQYTCPNYAGSITSFTMRYSVTQIAKTDAYTPTGTSGTYLIDELKVSGTISTGNIYFTGNLYRNGQIYTSATSVTTGDLLVAGSLSAGNIAVSTTLTGANLAMTSATLGSLVAPNVISTSTTLGSLVATNSNVTNGTVGALVATSITAANLAVPGTLTVVNITSTNLVDTNITATSALVTGGLRATFNSNTVGSIFTTGGNVGINTTAPDRTLTINGQFITYSNSQNIFQSGTGGSYMYQQNVAINNTTGYTAIGGWNSNTNNSIPLCLNHFGGNIGIGTTSPTSVLFVQGSLNSEIGAHIKNINSGSGAYSIVRVGSDNNSGTLSMFLNSTTRTIDGGANTATIRNDVGAIRLHSSAAGITVNTNGNVIVDGTTTLGGNVGIRVYVMSGVFPSSRSGQYYTLPSGLSVSNIISITGVTFNSANGDAVPFEYVGDNGWIVYYYASLSQNGIFMDNVGSGTWGRPYRVTLIAA